MHGVKNSPWNPILFALPNKNYYLRERERERERERRKGLMKSHIQTYVAYFSSALYCSLCLCLSFLFSLSLLCVYLLSLFVSAFFFFSLPSFLFFFFFPRSSSIYRETPKKLFPYFSHNRSDRGAVFVSIFPPQFLISCWAVSHYSAFGSFICFIAF